MHAKSSPVQSFSVVRGSKNFDGCFRGHTEKSERLPRAKYDSRIVPIIHWNTSKRLILHGFLQSTRRAMGQSVIAHSVRAQKKLPTGEGGEMRHGAAGRTFQCCWRRHFWWPLGRRSDAGSCTGSAAARGRERRERPGHPLDTISVQGDAAERTATSHPVLRSRPRPTLR